MGKQRDSGGQAAQETPSIDTSSDVNAQQSLFGDMMRAQAENRQRQLAMRMDRIGRFGGGLLNMQQQMANPAIGYFNQLQGLLQGIQQAQMQQAKQQQQQQSYDISGASQGTG